MEVRSVLHLAFDGSGGASERLYGAHYQGS